MDTVHRFSADSNYVERCMFIRHLHTTNLCIFMVSTILLAFVCCLVYLWFTIHVGSTPKTIGINQVHWPWNIKRYVYVDSMIKPLISILYEPYMMSHVHHAKSMNHLFIIDHQISANITIDSNHIYLDTHPNNHIFTIWEPWVDSHHRRRKTSTGRWPGDAVIQEEEERDRTALVAGSVSDREFPVRGCCLIKGEWMADVD